MASKQVDREMVLAVKRVLAVINGAGCRRRHFAMCTVCDSCMRPVPWRSSDASAMKRTASLLRMSEEDLRNRRDPKRTSIVNAAQKADLVLDDRKLLAGG
jgi:hypothetical protein